MTNSNSPLVCYTKISQNKNVQQSKAIKYVAVHCVVGQCLIESLGALFALPSKQASSNYGVDKDGRIGMFVEEKDRSWCTSSALVDGNGVSIEVASDMSEPFAVRNEAYTALLDLLEDICRRNGKTKMIWFGDKAKSLAYQPKDHEIVMMVHRWFSGKSCPGTYLYNLHPTIAKEINKRLGSASDPAPAPTPTPTPQTIKKGDCVKIKAGATYTNGRPIPNLVLAETWIVEAVNGKNVLIDKSVKNGWAINSWVDEKYLTVIGKSFEPYVVKVDVDALNIRLAPTTLSAVVGTIRDRGGYTIVAEEDGVGATRWGKLKSGAGWISLDYVHKL